LLASTISIVQIVGPTLWLVVAVSRTPLPTLGADELALREIRQTLSEVQAGWTTGVRVAVGVDGTVVDVAEGTAVAVAEGTVVAVAEGTVVTVAEAVGGTGVAVTEGAASVTVKVCCTGVASA
jgi:hypothetical protein